MAEQWNTITTMQMHTGNSQFKFVNFKRGSHLSKFWHSEGHKYLQRDAAHIAALIQGVCQTPYGSCCTPPCICPPCLSSSWSLCSTCCCQICSTPVPPLWYRLSTSAPSKPPMQPAQKRSRTEQRDQAGNKDSKCRPHHAHAWLQACNRASRVVDPRHIPEISKKSIVKHNSCSYGAAFKQVWAKPINDNTLPPPQFAGWTLLHKSVYDAYSKLPGRQI